ncbi:MAG: DegT/DnrJ/EryC1/StrS family aminotransferase [Planctomycetales bacterium]
MAIPILDLKAHHAPLRGEILAAIEKVFDTNAFILGPQVQELETQIAKYCQSAHAIGVSSGTDALLVALMALDVKAGDEVITTPYSFFATAGCITRLGAVPVFVDIDPVSFNINPAGIEAKITSKTKAIIPVHLYGQCADMDPIMAIAGKHNLPVIEDGAQAIGSEYKDKRRACSIGTMGCLSFFPSKNLGALGDGGMVTTNDAALAEKLKILRVHGSKPKYYHKMIGGNFRLDSMQAAVLSVKLKYLDQWTAKRQKNAQRYAELFQKTNLVSGGKVKLPKPVYLESGAPHYHIYNQFVLRVQDRDALREFLQKQKSIGTEIYYPVPFHTQECFSYLGYKAGDFPESEKAANETVALPIYPELTDEQLNEVVQGVVAFYAQS